MISIVTEDCSWAHFKVNHTRWSCRADSDSSAMQIPLNSFTLRKRRKMKHSSWFEEKQQSLVWNTPGDLFRMLQLQMTTRWPISTQLFKFFQMIYQFFRSLTSNRLMNVCTFPPSPKRRSSFTFSFAVLTRIVMNCCSVMETSNWQFFPSCNRSVKKVPQMKKFEYCSAVNYHLMKFQTAH